MATVLKMLLEEQHLKSHPEFLAAYDRCAAQLDPPVPPGHGPAKAQFYQWLSGRMVGLPREYHRRVLEKMFPEWTVEELFQEAGPASMLTRSHRGSPGSHARLGEFFGAEMISRGSTLVYPAFELSEPSARALRDAGVPRQHVFGKADTDAPEEQHRDLRVVLPENEMRGLLYVLSMLWRYTDTPPRIRSDRDLGAHRDLPYIGFGLHGNACVHHYVDTAASPLFTLRNGTDAAGFGPAQVRLSDGRCYTSDGTSNTGIIARVRPAPDVHPNRYQLFCGGLGPRGSAGAGWYIANYWALLQHRVGAGEFVAVVGVDTDSDRTTGLHHVLTRPVE